MARIFKTPFGAQGDTEQVPEAPQGDGSVSLTQGFGYDYEREYEDPAAKDIRREVMNGLFHDVTEAIGDIQLSGIAKWSADAAPYPTGAVVWHNSVAWMSTAGNNSSEPGAGNWKAVDLSSSIRLSESIDQVPDAETVQQALARLGEFAGDGYENVAVFDTPGVTNWAVPDVLRQGLRKAHVTVIGSGGSGAQGVTPSGDQTGGGGGAGGVAEGIYDLSGLDSVTITVGEGGSSRSSAGAGSSGGSSSFGTILSAGGGGGGQLTDGTNGGASGLGVGGNIGNRRLGVGRAGPPTAGPSTSIGGSGGGPGGGPGNANSSDSTSRGTLPGAGGGASYGGGSGSGARGEVVIRW